MRFEKLGFIRLNDVVLAALQFDMSSGESIERSTRTDEFTGETRNSQYHNVSEDCLRSGCGTSECGESIGDTIFLRDGKRALSEKTLRNKSERVPESELVPLADHLFLSTSGDLSETNPGDRAHRRPVSAICPSPIAVRVNGERRKRKNVVTFNPEIVVHLIPYEDRSSEWMRHAIDRAHFQRRVQLFEELFTAL